MTQRRLPAEWKRVHEGDATDYRIFRLRQDSFRNPRDGSEHPRMVLETPDWVNIIPITMENQVVMVRQFRTGISANTLELPGGMVEPGEDPIHAAARELEEETGYRPGRVIPLTRSHPNPAIQNNVCHSFIGYDCKKVHDGAQDAGEDILVELIDRASIPQRLASGEITHSLIMLAFLYERFQAELTTPSTRG